MRDSSEGMIEIIDAVKSDGNYFAIISVPKKAQRRKFRFGVTLSAYRAIRRMLGTRPLDTMPGLKYRYFWTGSTIWTGSMSGKTEKKIGLRIRCEVGKNGKSKDFEVPHSFAANLQWFAQLDTFNEAEHLHIET